MGELVLFRWSLTYLNYAYCVERFPQAQFDKYGSFKKLNRGFF